MGRQARKTFSVNGRTYTVEQMNPSVAFRFGLDVAAAIGPALVSAMSGGGAGAAAGALAAIETTALNTDKLAALSAQAWQYLIFPDNSRAKDALRFETWFGEYPADIFPVTVKAVWALVEDFFPAGTLIIGETPASESPKA